MNDRLELEIKKEIGEALNYWENNPGSMDDLIAAYLVPRLLTIFREEVASFANVHRIRSLKMDESTVLNLAASFYLHSIELANEARDKMAGFA